MMANYSQWHTERAPSGKKVNSVEEISSLSEKVDMIMSMLATNQSSIDPNNVPLASLIAQEKDQVDVNFFNRNNFNNNAYRNNFGSNKYKPYPPHGVNLNGNHFNNVSSDQGISNNRLNEIEKSTKKFMHEQYEQKKSSLGI